ncbi:MAG TPA: SDR family NAD(P)-dependent oxidoreductase [Solirubrobacteraceae bacterium]|jgi:NAD(P)-dependent dehydrogenase (short-subunit alcohol dehydrogenase family)|nr:SDR family NAD(P)-dependent oxidoreductase [Solirubrobacteraceae bacterium]
MAGVEGRVALVTGAASGIGASAARLLARDGAAVSVCDVDLAGAESVAREIEAAGGSAVAHALDIGSAAQTEAVVAATVARWGRLDAVAACAGVVRHGKAPEFAESDWDYVIDTNLKGLFLTAKYTIPALASSGGGSIVTVSSVNAVASSRMIPAYAASKGGIVSLTRTLALDHAVDGIRVNCILPGSVDTAMLRASAKRRFPDDPQAAIAGWGDKHPLGRVLTADEVAHAIVFLSSAGASGITGATLAVDGGLTALLAL